MEQIEPCESRRTLARAEGMEASSAARQVCAYLSTVEAQEVQNAPSYVGRHADCDDRPELSRGDQTRTRPLCAGVLAEGGAAHGAGARADGVRPLGPIPPRERQR